MKSYVPDAKLLAQIEYYESIRDQLDEVTNRRMLALLAESGGRGAQHYIAQKTHTDRKTIARGRKELHHEIDLPEPGKVRLEGSGRPSIVSQHPELYDAIHEIVDDYTYGNPMKILTWTNLSERKIAERLKEDYGINISYVEVGVYLKKMGYSLHENRKMLQAGKESPERDQQFQFINGKAKEFIENGQPVISVDAKKKENLGNFKNNGREYRPKGDPRLVNDHDFLDKKLGQVAPYGVYVENNNTAFVNLGIDHDTSDFAVESIRRWWTVGHATFPNATRLYITCDGGGSNGSRCRLWKKDLAKLAQETGLEIWVSHFPPGTSKWNKIEHHLFGYITRNWAVKPLVDIETVVELIGSTTTKTGLKVKCVVDRHEYPTGQKVSDEEMADINITHCEKLLKCNYYIKGIKH